MRQGTKIAGTGVGIVASALAFTYFCRNNDVGQPEIPSSAATPVDPVGRPMSVPAQSERTQVDNSPSLPQIDRAAAKIEHDIKGLREIMAPHTREALEQAFSKVRLLALQYGDLSNEYIQLCEQIGPDLYSLGRDIAGQQLAKGELSDTAAIAIEMYSFGVLSWFSTDIQHSDDFAAFATALISKDSLPSDGEFAKQLSRTSEFIQAFKQSTGEDFRNRFQWSDLISQSAPYPAVQFNQVRQALDSEHNSNAARLLTNSISYFHQLSVSDPHAAFSGMLQTLSFRSEMEDAELFKQAEQFVNKSIHTQLDLATDPLMKKVVAERLAILVRSLAPNEHALREELERIMTQ